MKVTLEHAALLVVDMQPKLLAAMDQSEALLRSAAWIVRAAHKLDMPIVFSEQYPNGLGSTVMGLSALAKEAPRFEKMSFSCLDNESLKKALNPFSQIVIIGIEAHICVLQTVLDLLQLGNYDVFVVDSAVGSRNPKNKQTALTRMQVLGAQIISPEMFLCECLKTADHLRFGEFSKEFLKQPPE